MTSFVPAAPIATRPVVVAGHTGPTGPSMGVAPAAMEVTDALVELVQDLRARVAALEAAVGKQ